jgi:DNA-binding LacI/PurR family transcriptional regulator
MVRTPSGRITVEDVATRAGVSVATVSRALRGISNVSETTRAKVLRAAIELDYRIDRAAASLASGQRRALGVIAPIGNGPQISDVLGGIDEIIGTTDQDLMIVSGVDPGPHRIHSLRSGVDGIVIIALGRGPDELTDLVGGELPTVVIGPKIHHCRSMVIDEAGAAAALVDLLADRGHHDIAVLGVDPSSASSTPIAAVRRAAFIERLEARGRTPRVVLDVTDSVEGGMAVAEVLLDNEAVTAVCCATDLIAFGLLTAAHQRGLKIPDQLSVVGVDDRDASLAFGLTTVRQPLADAGRRATVWLLSELGVVDAPVGPMEQWSHLPWQLVERATVATR